jgi:transcription termination factor Rho
LSVLDRASLEQSPLADLHAIASELSLDGYRRLRREDLIDAILERQGGEEAADEQPSARRRRGRRGGRGRAADDNAATAAEAEIAEKEDGGPHAEGVDEGEHQQAPESPAEETVEGTIELLPNGSAFLRVHPPEPSDDDIYVSAAQVRRCELVSGDLVSGPRRPPRRSERFASLLRVDTINGRPAAELADGARFEDLPASFPSERLPLDSDDLTITTIAELAPIGYGSRVTIAGAAQSGKSEALRRMTVALAGREGLQLWLALVGVRPEEAWEWQSAPVQPAVSLTLSASAEAQGQAVQGVVEQARRMTARGGNTVVLIDTLEQVSEQLARRALASARNLVDGGSLTVIATAPVPFGGETTVITLDASLARAGQFPAVDPATSWTMRRELLGG